MKKKLDETQIRHQLLNPEKYTFIILDEVTSTNDIAKANFKDEHQYLICLAEKQTNGQGRLGRTFISNESVGIYMSLIFKPNNSIKSYKNITTYIATCVAKSLEDVLNLKINIKWVNDIYLNGKKIGGILTTGETNVTTLKYNYLIIGIGINIYKQKFEENIKNIASSIEEETNKIIDRNYLIALILNQIGDNLDMINNNHMNFYRERLLMKNKQVLLKYAYEEEIVQIIDVDDEGRLIVKKDNIIKKVNSGEITRMIVKNA